VHVHKAGLGVHLGRRQTRQHRVLQLARDTPTGRHKARTGRGRVVGALAPPGHSVREIVDARAGAPVLLQDSDRLVSIAAPVFEVGGWSPHRGAKAAKPRGHRVARPGGGDSDSKTGDAGQSTGRWPVLRVLGSTGQDGHNLARAQAKAASNQPDETMTAGGRAQGQAPQSARGIAAHDGESRAPIADRVRTRGFRDATARSEEWEHARHGTQTDPYFYKEAQSQPHEVDLVVHDQPVGLGFVLP
jgi:hypothetical protein